jgi:hypothetical protein
MPRGQYNEKKTIGYYILVHEEQAASSDFSYRTKFSFILGECAKIRKSMKMALSPVILDHKLNYFEKSIF